MVQSSTEVNLNSNLDNESISKSEIYQKAQQKALETAQAIEIAKAEHKAAKLYKKRVKKEVQE